MDIKPTDYELSKNLINKMLSNGSITEEELDTVLDSIDTNAKEKDTSRHPFIMMTYDIDSIRTFHVISLLNKSFTFIDNFEDYTDVSPEDINKFIKKNNIQMHKKSETSLFELNECMICLDEIDKIKSNDLTTLYCSHYYHTKCIDEWLKKSSNCPICKRSIYKIVFDEWFDIQYNKWIDEISQPKKRNLYKIKFKQNYKMCVIS